MPITADKPARKKSQLELDNLALARQLLKLEPLGVLTREICYHPIPTEAEDPGMFGAKTTKSWGIIPPRLFFIPKYFTLVHCYGDERFYERHPEYVKGGLSKECYVVDDFPRHLANYFAMEPTYRRVGLTTNEQDPLSLSARKPPPTTQKDHNETRRRVRQRVKDQVAAYEKEQSPVLRVVGKGGLSGQTT